LPSAGSALGHKALGTVTAAEWVELRSIPRIQAAVIVETPFHADSGADDVAISSAETSIVNSSVSSAVLHGARTELTSLYRCSILFVFYVDSIAIDQDIVRSLDYFVDNN